MRCPITHECQSLHTEIATAKSETRSSTPTFQMHKQLYRFRDLLQNHSFRTIWCDTSMWRSNSQSINKFRLIRPLSHCFVADYPISMCHDKWTKMYMSFDSNALTQHSILIICSIIDWLIRYGSSFSLLFSRSRTSSYSHMNTLKCFKSFCTAIVWIVNTRKDICNRLQISLSDDIWCTKREWYKVNLLWIWCVH